MHAVGSEDMPVHAFLCMTENKTEWRKDQKQEMVNMLHQSLIIKLYMMKLLNRYTWYYCACCLNTQKYTV